MHLSSLTLSTDLAELAASNNSSSSGPRVENLYIYPHTTQYHTVFLTTSAHLAAQTQPYLYNASDCHAGAASFGKQWNCECLTVCFLVLKLYTHVRWHTCIKCLRLAVRTCLREGGGGMQCITSCAGSTLRASILQSLYAFTIQLVS